MTVTEAINKLQAQHNPTLEIFAQEVRDGYLFIKFTGTYGGVIEYQVTL